LIDGQEDPLRVGIGQVRVDSRHRVLGYDGVTGEFPGACYGFARHWEAGWEARRRGTRACTVIQED